MLQPHGIVHTTGEAALRLVIYTLIDLKGCVKYLHYLALIKCIQDKYQRERNTKILSLTKIVSEINKTEISCLLRIVTIFSLST